VPADLEAADRGRQEHQAYAEHRSRQARLNARIASIPVPSGVLGKALYQAIDAYADRAVEQMAKESGKVEAATARRLKAGTPDMDLGEFGYSAIERIRTYWAARPEAKLRGGKGAGRAISLTTVDNHLSTARRFVRWLDRSDAYAWEMPRHGVEALTVNLKRLRTGDELASRRHGVKVLGADQLAVVYRHATDFERLLLLLGLNAAMAQAEIITLRWDEIEVDPPAIKRIRRKTSVYGEFALWQETQAALGWWRRVRPPTGPLVMVTSTGQPYTRTRISNAWAHVRDRIARDAGVGPDWWLPFKHLRKSAAQLVRRASDGEVAGTFLSHGTPVATDDLADRYSNRPFDKVAAALGLVQQELSPMFAAAPDAFQGNALGRGPQRQAGRPSA
jgi:integrase